MDQTRNEDQERINTEDQEADSPNIFEETLKREPEIDMERHPVMACY